MYCSYCENRLEECTCPDLQERLESLKVCKALYVSPAKMRLYEEQAKRNKERAAQQTQRE